MPALLLRYRAFPSRGKTLQDLLRSMVLPAESIVFAPLA